MIQADSNQAFFRTIQAGDLTLFHNFPEAIALFGFTKAGKTTSAHYLCNNPLKAVTQYGELMYQLATQRCSSAVIGNRLHSQTQIPNIFKANYRDRNGVNREIVILDQPGYGDSYGFFRILSNGYFHYRTFSKTPRLKFILTISYKELSGTGAKFQETINIFMSTFALYNEMKNDIMKATVLIITKFESTEKDHDKKLKDLHQKIKVYLVCRNLTNQHRLRFEEFVHHMIANNKIFFFEKPENVYCQTKQNNLLKSILQITDFWERREQNNIVSMSAINFSVGSQILTQLSSISRNNRFKQDFNLFMREMKARIKQILYQHQFSFAKIVKQIKVQAATHLNAHSFLPQMKKFIQIYYRFDDNFKRKREETQISLFATDNADMRLMYFTRKFNFLEHLSQKQSQVCNIFDKLKFDRSVEELQQISQIFISIAKKMSLLRLPEVRDSHTTLLKYNYIIQRLIQECKIISLVLYSDSKMKEEFDRIQLGMVDVFPTLKDEVFRQDQFEQSINTIKLKLVPHLDNLEKYNQQIISFLQSIIDQSPIVKFKVVNAIVKYSKGLQKNAPLQEKQYLIKKTLHHRSRFYEYYRNIVIQQNPPQEEVKSSIHQSIVLLNMAKMWNNVCAEVRMSVEIIFNLTNVLGNALLGLSEYCLAREVYKSVNNASCVFNIFEMEIKTLDPTKTKDLYLEYAKYAQENHRRELAIRCFQEAYSRCETYNQINTITNKIQSLARQPPLKQLGSNKQFCRDIPNDVKVKIQQKCKKPDISLLKSL